MKTILFSFLCFVFVSLQAQNNILALAGENEQGINFKGIENISTQKSIFQTSSLGDLKNAQFTYVNAVYDLPNSKFTASLATDNNGHVYFMPMISSNIFVMKNGKINQLVNNNQIHVVTSNEGTFFTRMTLASDQNIYALNNDGSELIQINTANNVVTNLGAVQTKSKESISDKNFGWGGDMIADNRGDLYVISAMAHIFKVNISTLQSEYIGKISGLPNNFTTNGAAVLEDGRILLASSKGNGMYAISLNNLRATPYSQYNTPVYDLASPYFVSSSLQEEVIHTAAGITLYPTVVSEKKINLISDKNLRNAKVEVYNLSSMKVAEFSVNLQEKEESNFSLKQLRPNIYIVKVIDSNGLEVLNQKITVVK